MTTPEQLAIRSLRNQSGWWEGDENAKRVLSAYRASVLAPLIAALSFDPETDRDLETCARRLYHERSDLARALEKATEEAVALRLMLHPTQCHDLPPQVH